MNDEELGRTLNRIAGILQIAHEQAINETRGKLMEDETNKAIFKATAKWVATGELEEAVVEKGPASRSTLFRRLGELVDRGLLERREAGGKVQYRNSGLI
jgi:DNA-binding transcriptional ArsR family regulator